MGRMITDAKVLLDQHGHPRRGPDFAAKPVGSCSFGKQVGQLSQLVLSQFGLRARRRLMTQGLLSLRFGTAYPLTDRPFGHAQRLGNVFLFPTGLIQLPSAQATIFAPVVGKGVFLAHTSFHRLARVRTLGPHAEVNNNFYWFEMDDAWWSDLAEVQRLFELARSFDAQNDATRA